MVLVPLLEDRYMGELERGVSSSTFTKIWYR
jgi:hypothetical protein